MRRDGSGKHDPVDPVSFVVSFAVEDRRVAIGIRVLEPLLVFQERPEAAILGSAELRVPLGSMNLTRAKPPLTQGFRWQARGVTRRTLRVRPAT